MEVKLIDVFGSDIRVVNAARVSFHKESDWEDETISYKGVVINPKLSEADQKLIKYLATHNHWSPFAHVSITMKEKVPIFIARQRFKHRIGFEYNEVSRRYVDDPPEFYTPKIWRKRAENKKQGSSDEEVSHWPDVNTVAPAYETITSTYDRFISHAECLYAEMIEAGVAPEQARMVLPQSMYTEYMVTGSLAAWARAYKLRSEEHSQQEIRELASQWNKIISEIKELKYSWQALTI